MMKRLVLPVLMLCCAPLLVAGASKDASIQRLDGSSITIVEAQRFAQKTTCMIILTNSDNGELAFRPLLETIIGDTVGMGGLYASRHRRSSQAQLVRR